MLEPEPIHRMTIDDINNHEWMKNFSAVPKTKLNTINNLKVNNEDWHEFRENIGIELKERRIDWDQNIEIKTLENIKNPLYNRRKLKSKSKETSTEEAGKTSKNSLKIAHDENDSEKTLKIKENIPMVFVSSNSSINLKRSNTLPNKSSALTALYYSSNLNDNSNINI
jgi:hypothetical protein